LTPDSEAPTLFIGTHALLTPRFEISKLGLVIIDEQHKFGVAQREQLVRKGSYPHLLVMTATPIPRSLGLTLYGDLDLSVIDELPRGRGTVRTFVRTEAQLPKVHEFIRQKLAAGRQAYVVFSRIEETESAGTLKAIKGEATLLEKAFAPHRVGVLHGQIGAAERDRIVSAFRANELGVLLATSVIEVGVDVPNATVMLIENAEQFGLAQLHQLRGRIGRGAHESYCILVTHALTPEARQRIEVMKGTADGFEIAEADMKLRGPGEFLGAAQSGLPPFRFANLLEDTRLLELSRDLAARLERPALQATA
jgi:ATP-dependent DNA helicase RecG